MKKKVIALIMASVIGLGSFSATTVYGATDVNKLYSSAFEAVTKCQNDKSQKSVNEAREKINALFGTGAEWAVGEFSKQVDWIQHPILVKIVDGIARNQKNPTQADINDIKACIVDLPNDSWKRDYGSALDKAQQTLINAANSLVEKFISSKMENDKIAAMEKLNELKSATNNKSVVDWALSKVIEVEKVEVQTPPVPPTESKDVVFKDTILENEIRKIINKPTGTILKTDVEGIKELDLSGLGIRKIDGLEHFKALTKLNLGTKMIPSDNNLGYDFLMNYIEDGSALQNLNNLEMLSLQGNNISNINFVSGLTNIKQMFLDGNPFTDIEPLKGSKTLTKLSLTVKTVGKDKIEELQKILTNCYIAKC